MYLSWWHTEQEIYQDHGPSMTRDIMSCLLIGTFKAVTVSCIKLLIMLLFSQDRLEKLHKNIAKETARHKAAIDTGQ